jgi:hypothetical protein
MLGPSLSIHHEKGVAIANGQAMQWLYEAR